MSSYLLNLLQKAPFILTLNKWSVELQPNPVKLNAWLTFKLIACCFSYFCAWVLVQNMLTFAFDCLSIDYDCASGQADYYLRISFLRFYREKQKRKQFHECWRREASGMQPFRVTINEMLIFCSLFPCLSGAYTPWIGSLSIRSFLTPSFQPGTTTSWWVHARMTFGARSKIARTLFYGAVLFNFKWRYQRFLT